MTKIALILILLLVLGVISISGCGDSGNSSSVNSKALTTQDYNTLILPNVIEYNKTKGEQLRNFTPQGTVIELGMGELGKTNSTPNGRDLNITNDRSKQLTLIIRVNQYENHLGKKTYSGYGYDTNGNIKTRTYDVYQQVLDYVVVYWPENKIIGWFRASEPDRQEMTYTETQYSTTKHNTVTLSTWLHQNMGINSRVHMGNEEGP
ncbi:MAG: hypothetical protein HZC47_04355 [Methanobacterium sp.]|uniref:hypothetical protein n=1 Tax=Methanobacterium sp. TaxID=2164 RepID=UPI003D65F91F|nr:hypothetical protein [Methanobacterium sp.]